MSADLQWLLVRNNSSFLVKRNGVQFTSEPGNLTQKNSFKFSGLANNKTVGLKVVAVKDKKKVAIVTKSTKPSQQNKPATQLRTRLLTKGMRANTCRAAQAIKTETAKSFYRGDLSRFAVARWHALTKTLKPVVVNAKAEKRKRRGAAKKQAAVAAKASA